MDFEAHVDSAAKPKASVDRLNALIKEAEALNARMLELEGEFTQLMSRYNFIKTTELPELMSEMQTTEWVGEGGVRLRLNQFVSGALPKDPEKLAVAIRWLEDNGGGPNIKSELSVPFSKSQHNEALSIRAELEEKGYAPTLTSSVHASTLQAFARERLNRGETVPFATLGLYAGTVAEIDHPKGKASKKIKRTKGKKDGDDASED